MVKSCMQNAVLDASLFRHIYNENKSDFESFLVHEEGLWFSEEYAE